MRVEVKQKEIDTRIVTITMEGEEAEKLACIVGADHVISKVLLGVSESKSCEFLKRFYHLLRDAGFHGYHWPEKGEI